MGKRITIAIDGLSSCGKSSFARAIARELGYIYIDTGAMYRAVTLAVLRGGGEALEELEGEALRRLLEKVKIGFALAESGRLEVTLNGEFVEHSIRGEAVNSLVSQVASLPMVRDMLVAQQREIGKHGGVVMDGRDIGQVVFPRAELKIFMTADIDVRARRRYEELRSKGQEIPIEKVRENLAMRDEIDQSRGYSPMRRAEDAIVLDNTHMTPAEQMEWLRPLLRERLGGSVEKEIR